MKEEKICNKCKVVCVECANFETDLTCLQFPIKKMNCVNGTENCSYDLCVNHNENGDCKKFERDEERTATQKLIYAIEKYKEYKEKNMGYTEGLLDDILWNALEGLRGKYMHKLCYLTRDERIKKKCESESYGGYI